MINSAPPVFAKRPPVRIVAELADEFQSSQLLEQLQEGATKVEVADMEGLILPEASFLGPVENSANQPYIETAEEEHELGSDGQIQYSTGSAQLRSGDTKTQVFMYSNGLAEIILPSNQTRLIGLKQYNINFDEIASRFPLLAQAIESNFVIQSREAKPFQIGLTLSAPNDAYFDSQWGLEALGVLDAWEFNYGEGIIVAVIDESIDYTHPDLAANIWINSGEIEGNGIDDDDNGYIDDYRGWDIRNNDNDPYSANSSAGHGTHVAGIIGALNDNNVGVSGVAPKSQIMAIQGFNFDDDNRDPVAAASVTNAVYYAVDNGARVINMSLGISPLAYSTATLQAFEDALAYAKARDVIVVVAAGNNFGFIDAYPALFDDVITVGALAITSPGFYYLDNYSSIGSSLDFVAPGSDILSLRSKSGYENAYDPDSSVSGDEDEDYTVISGTSMAAPHLAGIVALLLAQDPAQGFEDIYRRLKYSAYSGPTDYSESLGYGLINYSALYQDFYDDGRLKIFYSPSGAYVLLAYWGVSSAIKTQTGYDQNGDLEYTEFFHETGELEKVVARNGDITYYYKSSERISIEYTAASGVTDEFLNEDYNGTGKGRLVKSVAANGELTLYAYWGDTAWGDTTIIKRLILLTANGNIIRYTRYFSDGNVLAIRNSANDETFFFKDSQLIYAEFNAETGIRNEYLDEDFGGSGKGRLVKKLFLNGEYILYTYIGNTDEVDTQKRYDSEGNEIGAIVITLYGSGRVHTETDVTTGIVLTYADEDFGGSGKGRLILKTMPDGSYTTYTEYFGNTAQEKFQKEYDSSNRLLRTHEYDANGMLQPDYDNLTAYFERFADENTGMAISHIGSVNSLQVTHAYDAALYILAGGATSNKVLDHLATGSGFVLNTGYAPANGVYIDLSTTGVFQPGFDRYNIHAGPNAWLGIAALYGYGQSDNINYLEFAKARANFLVDLLDPADGGIRMGPIGQFHPLGNDFFWRIKSTENNMSVLALFDALVEQGQSAYAIQADKVWTYLKSMYDPINHIFSRGAKFNGTDWVKDELVDFATDTIGWIPLDRVLSDDYFGATLFDRLSEVEHMIAQAELLTGVYDDDGNLLGFSFSASSKVDSIISIEWSAQFISLYQKMAQSYKQIGNDAKHTLYTDKATALRNSIEGYFVVTAEGDVAAPYAVFQDGSGAYDKDTGHDFRTPACDSCSIVYSASGVYMKFARLGVDPLRHDKPFIDNINYITTADTYIFYDSGNLKTLLDDSDGTLYEYLDEDFYNNSTGRVSKKTLTNGNYTLYTYVTNSDTIDTQITYDGDGIEIGTSVKTFYASGSIKTEYFPTTGIFNEYLDEDIGNGNRGRVVLIRYSSGDFHLYAYWGSTTVVKRKYELTQNGNLILYTSYYNNGAVSSVRGPQGNQSFYYKNSERLRALYAANTGTYLEYIDEDFNSTGRGRLSKQVFANGDYILYTYVGATDVILSEVMYDKDGNIINDIEVVFYEASGRVQKEYKASTQFTKHYIDEDFGGSAKGRLFRETQYIDSAIELITEYVEYWGDAAISKLEHFYSRDRSTDIETLVQTLEYLEDGRIYRNILPNEQENGALYEQVETFLYYPSTHLQSRLFVETFQDGSLKLRRETLYYDVSERIQSFFSTATVILDEFLDEDFNNTGEGRLTKRTFPNGNYTVYTYVGNTDVIETERTYDADGNEILVPQFTYYPNGRVKTEFDPATGILLEYYDEDYAGSDQGRILRQTLSDNSYRIYTYVGDTALVASVIQYDDNDTEISGYEYTYHNSQRIRTEYNRSTGTTQEYENSDFDSTGIGRVLLKRFSDGIFELYAYWNDTLTLKRHFVITGNGTLLTYTQYYSSGDRASLKVTNGDITYYFKESQRIQKEFEKLSGISLEFIDEDFNSTGKGRLRKKTLSNGEYFIYTYVGNTDEIESETHYDANGNIASGGAGLSMSSISEEDIYGASGYSEMMMEKNRQIKYSIGRRDYSSPFQNAT
ncbi:MAG: subtilisin family serine protease [Candidatus Omnitrophota bacterium]|jgi:subtilisin family serine protease